MNFLPIVERELRARARRQTTYWMRVGVGGCGALLCVMQLSFGGSSVGAAAVGQHTFLGLVTAAFLSCCGAFVLTADSISSERREGTLGLLYLTRVRGRDVLLGKLGAAGIMGLCAIIVFVPVLMIPVLSGGVTGGEVFRNGLVLMNTLFIGLVSGLLASAEGEARAGAFRKALVLLGSIMLVPVPFYIFRNDLPPWSHFVAAFSPFTSLVTASDAQYRIGPAQYWHSVIQLHLLGCGLLWYTTVVLRRSLREPGSVAAISEPRLTLERALSVTQKRSQPLRGDIDPITWLLRRQRGLTMAVWAGVAIGASYWLLLPLVVRFITTGLGLQAFLWPTTFVTQSAKACLFAWVASRFFVDSRRSGALELLATTPHGATALVSAQWEMLRRLFRLPVIVLLLPILFQAFTVLVIRSSAFPGDWQVYYAVALGLSAVNTWLSVVSFCWVGMWFGLRAHSQSSAVIWTAGLVGLLPYLLNWMFSLMASIAARFLSNTGPVLYFMSSSVSSLAVLVFNLWLIHRTRNLLGSDLRLSELQPLSLAKALGAAWRDGAMVIRGARHWTPS